MTPFVRISTSPPNDWPGIAGEGSHYCDLRELDDWRSSPLLHLMPEDAREEALRSGMAGYAVVGTYADRGFGLLVCVEDGEEGCMFLGIDNQGRTRREPAANEALWDAANAAMGPFGGSGRLDDEPND